MISHYTFIRIYEEDQNSGEQRREGERERIGKKKFISNADKSNVNASALTTFLMTFINVNKLVL